MRLPYLGPNNSDMLKTIFFQKTLYAARDISQLCLFAETVILKIAARR